MTEPPHICIRCDRKVEPRRSFGRTGDARAVYIIRRMVDGKQRWRRLAWVCPPCEEKIWERFPPIV